MASISDRIRLLRTESHMTQEEFGRIFGISKPTVSFYEHGKSVPNDQIKTAIARYFGVSVDYLLGVTDSRELTSPTPAAAQRPVEAAIAGSSVPCLIGSSTGSWGIFRR